MIFNAYGVFTPQTYPEYFDDESNYILMMAYLLPMNFIEFCLRKIFYKNDNNIKKKIKTY